MRAPSSRRRDGFTLVELSIVLLLIGLMTAFLLAASWEGVRRGNERATQALIAKLDQGIIDRWESLLSQRPPVNNAHRFLALSAVPDAGAPGGFRYIESNERAALIAKIDYLRMEMPDVFFVQDDANYPLNFAGQRFSPQGVSMGPGGGAATAAFGFPDQYAQYVLPLGHALAINRHYNEDARAFFPSGPDAPMTFLGQVTQLGDLPPQNPAEIARKFRMGPGGRGIFGASYQARAGLMKQLGVPPRGYNGVDDSGNGLVDELSAAELGMDSSDFAALQAEIVSNLGRHQHITARSEMLYAILVEGSGPFGSVFAADEFTDREVMDTDGDGLLEFVDAWGKPLQFYRWPVYFNSEYGVSRSLQKGVVPYAGPTEPREQNPLDPNQLLVAPSWWADLANMPATPDASNSSHMSGRANLFQQHFFSLVDPYADGNTIPIGTHWDRTGFLKRRAYFFKPLITSAGPDGQYGTGSFGLIYDPAGQEVRQVLDLPADAFSARMIVVENQAARTDPIARLSTDNQGSAGTLTIDQGGQPGRMSLYQNPSSGIAADASGLIQELWGLDDITNHTLNSPGTGAR